MKVKSGDVVQEILKSFKVQCIGKCDKEITLFTIGGKGGAGHQVVGVGKGDS